MVDHNGYSWADWIKKYKFTIKVLDGLKRVKKFIMDTKQTTSLDMSELTPESHRYLDVQRGACELATILFWSEFVTKNEWQSRSTTVPTK